MHQGGIEARMGAKKSESRKQRETTTAVRPVRPPSRMPGADSMYVVTGEVPHTAP